MRSLVRCPTRPAHERVILHEGTMSVVCVGSNVKANVLFNSKRGTKITGGVYEDNKLLYNLNGKWDSYLER